jgi:lysophospholipase L1-like esterase
MADQEYFELTDSAQAPVRAHKTGDKAMVINGSEVALVDQDSVQAAADARVEELRGWINGRDSYTTLALATVAGETTASVEVTNDPTESNNGIWVWTDGSLVKSNYDPLKTIELWGVEKNQYAEFPGFFDMNGIELLGFNDDASCNVVLSESALQQIGKFIGLADYIDQLGIEESNQNFPGIFDVNGIELLGFDENGKASIQLSDSVIASIQRRMTRDYDLVDDGYLPKQDITCWGDSMTQGAGGNGTNISSVLTSELGRTVTNHGIGGQTAPEIAVRAGNWPLLISVSGSTIPASGGVEITARNHNILKAGGSYTGTVAVTISGVSGIIRTDDSGVWTFTRDEDGEAVAVSDGVQAVITGSTSFISDPEARRSDTLIIWAGRNGLASDRATHIEVRDCILSIVEYAKPACKRFLVVSVCNGSAEYADTTMHTRIKDTNAELAATFGANFVDLRKYMVNHAIYDAGIEPTEQDLADIAGDTIPDSLRYDAVHLINTGYEMAGKFLARQIKSRGW